MELTYDNVAFQQISPAQNNEVEFNDAATQIQRLNFWEQEASKSFANLLLFDYSIGVYGFEMCLTSLNNIFYELSGDLSATELETLLKLKDTLDKASSSKLFFENTTTQTFGNYQNTVKINSVLFDAFKKILECYRLEIIKAKKKHGFSNPTKESSKLAMMR